MNLSVLVSLTITLIAGLCLNVSKNVFCKKYQHGISDTYMFVSANGVFAILAVVLMAKGNIVVSSHTLFYAVLYGVNWVLLTVVLNLALETGPLSYTTVISSLALILPTFSGWVFWSEKITALQLVGIVLMVICFILSNEKRNDDKKAKKVWYIYVSIAFVSNGLCGIIQKLHQSSAVADETTGFVFTALLISIVISTPLMLFFKHKEKKAVGCENQSARPKLGNKTKCIVLLLILTAGVCSGLVNQLNLHLAGVMDSAIFFPIVNGGNLILTTLFSVTVFRERPSGRQYIGLVIGCASVIMLCI